MLTWILNHITHTHIQNYCNYVNINYLLGNNVLRTIHGVGEMMTQMVMSRGVLHSLPDSPASQRYGKAHFMPDSEDVMVMDTKLKIIEILQVSNYD